MNNIIEKLGITKAPWKVYSGGNFVKVVNNEWLNKLETTRLLCGAVCEIDDYTEKTGHDIKNSHVVVNAQLIASAPEMLEALIESVLKAEKLNDAINEFDPDMLEEIYKTDKRIIAIEKATGKTWREIKDLLGDMFGDGRSY